MIKTCIGFGVILVSVIVLSACNTKVITAQEIVDNALEYGGGPCYQYAQVGFMFRDAHYTRYLKNGMRVETRAMVSDSTVTEDVLIKQQLKRYMNRRPISLPDSLAKKYANAVNSVHYFAFLPYRLNDVAVHKELLGEIKIKGKSYYKVKVTFDQQNGGEDFEDEFLYWFDTHDYSTDYLAYSYNVDGGGMRFREAYNERFINGLRFVDYQNYRPKDSLADLMQIDVLFTRQQLELVSKIELKEISVSGNCN